MLGLIRIQGKWLWIYQPECITRRGWADAQPVNQFRPFLHRSSHQLGKNSLNNQEFLISFSTQLPGFHVIWPIYYKLKITKLKCKCSTFGEGIFPTKNVLNEKTHPLFERYNPSSIHLVLKNIQAPNQNSKINDKQTPQFEGSIHSSHL